MAVVLSNTRAAAFQRANVYTKNIKQKGKHRFIEAFENKLLGFKSIYATKVSEERHVKYIQAFAHELSAEFSHVLQGGRMKIGVAQKAINLFLKYLWLLDDQCTEPPHCPIDRVVLNAVDIDENWTQLDSINRYLEMIGRIRQLAERKGQTLAVWELGIW